MSILWLLWQSYDYLLDEFINNLVSEVSEKCANAPQFPRAQIFSLQISKKHNENQLMFGIILTLIQ